MILEEAIVGGTIYADWLEGEMEKPEKERVSYEYRALTNREKIKLLHESVGRNGRPNGADVCLIAVTKCNNLQGRDGVLLDTIQKQLEYPDKGSVIAYSIAMAGLKIWDAQSGEGIAKNSE